MDKFMIVVFVIFGILMLGSIIAGAWQNVIIGVVAIGGGYVFGRFVL